ncbi:beta-lactamase-like protein 2 homolog isoform X2 [Aphidius gifuensis]|uniref:beta-lactamase-like protein 2 homolog isoform X2 n=1 Tax=Aphidius gifuensis TaxID=684658 RepID=UPI001CDBFC37|nr:beta-lactamase-like protein 2 homolog isoform X2 [Aphidius gifuensis]
MFFIVLIKINRRILIDSGDEDTSSKYIKHLDAVLKEENATIEHLIITHWHHDHIGGSKAVESLVKSSSNVTPTIWKFPRSSDDDNDTGYPVENWQHLVDEQLFHVEGAKLKIKYTPGHTTDHACLLLENENILFSGDCILGETTAVFEDLHDYMITLGKLLKLNSTCIYPGHGPVVDNPNVKINYYIQHRNKREIDILNVLKESSDNYLSVNDIVAKVYKDKDESLWPAAAKNVIQHLDKLLKENKVKKLNDLWLLI